MAINQPGGTQDPNNNGQTGAPDPAGFTQQPQDGAPGGFSESTGDLFEILNQIGSLSLSPEHKKFIEEVTDEAKKYVKNLEVVQLQSPAGSQAFVTEGEGGIRYALLVLFQDQIPANPELYPASDRIKDAYEAVMRRYNGNVRVINAILIAERDLRRTSQMINMVTTQLLSASRRDIRETNAQRLTANMEWVVDPNVSSALDLINRLSPNEVMPRADFGFTLGVRQGRRQQGFQWGQQPQVQVDPIIACVGYTEVLGPIPDPQTGIQKFLPLVHISNTVSLIPTLAAELMGMVQMTQFAVMNNGWKLPFKSFQPGKPNLGNLRMDPKDPHKLWFAPNADEMEQFIREQFYPPIVVMDVVDGAYRIPARNFFTGRRDQDNIHVMQEAARFFNAPPVPLAGPMATPFAQEFIGTFGDAVRTDSRQITYLNQACKGAMDQHTSMILLSYQQDPRDRAKVVANLTNSFSSLYRNRMSVLSSEFLVYLSRAVGASGMRIFDPTTQSGNVPLAGFIGGASNFTGFQNFAYQRQGGGNFDGWSGFQL